MDNVRDRARKYERSFARKVGGRTQLASGALPSVFKKGDVVTKTLLVDTKLTTAKSYGITCRLWEKLRREAWHQKREPAIVIRFETKNLELCVVSTQFLKEKGIL